MHEEIIDIVNDRDEVIATAERSKAMRDGMKHIRAVNAFIVNESGNVWVPTRHAKKKFFPLALDVSVGGFVQSGELYDAALVREAQEELNIDVATLPCEEVAYLSPVVDGVACFMRVYLIYTNQTPEFNDQDFSHGEWMSMDHLRSLISQGSPAKDDLCVLAFRLSVP